MRLPPHLPLTLALGLLAWAFLTSPTLTEIAAGIALFLFGMMSLEQGFKAFTGGALETVLRRSTNRLWKSLSFGAVATTLTQSSSLVSVITISFLSAGLMTLPQGIGVIFGANLGTTSGAWLIAGLGLKINVSAYAMPLLTFGVILIFNKAKPLKGMGYVLAGIGFLFLGIHYMKEGFEAYQDTLDLSQFAVAGLAGLLLYTLIGIIATVIMQSSHATLVLTITALAAGQITYENALALSIGANVGTTITALLGAVGANIEGRRLAGAHLIFNVVTGAIALSFIQVFLVAVEIGSSWLGIRDDNHTMRLALFHTLFNLTGIIVMVPFIPRLVHLLETRLKPKPVKLDAAKYINDNMLEMPAAALEASRQELVRLFGRVYSLSAQVLNYEPGQLRRISAREAFDSMPERLLNPDVDELYQRKVKPLHGLILDYLARVPVQGKRAQQLVMLRVANQQLIEAVKHAKHLQKNLLRYLNASNPHLRDEYRQLRSRLGFLLHELDRLSKHPEDIEDLDDLLLVVDDLGNDLERHDIVNNGRLDELIRRRLISAEQATSLMNDNSYAYRIGKNLLAVARATFLPFVPMDSELHDELALQPEEVKAIVGDMAAQAQGNEENRS
ncbi:MAG: Na/Pi cotransporter family protein [Wenzhouxiangella sp.]|nr:Na/Pi cotransporter family protein [Wenzhouxiangella sp.]MCH8477112.1 Na/Pi symporter [Wenzhouxiangella sp.]TVR95067.1 MAG: Na/Pi cotransporter family protein [Wenzhouxiangellaceae bacterium]